jgi:uncharacterized membrane protein YebE (DUF533 family)
VRSSKSGAVGVGAVGAAVVARTAAAVARTTAAEAGGTAARRLLSCHGTRFGWRPKARRGVARAAAAHPVLPTGPHPDRS